MLRTQYLDPAALMRIKNLELRARLVVEGFLSGRKQHHPDLAPIEHVDRRAVQGATHLDVLRARRRFDLDAVAHEFFATPTAREAVRIFLCLARVGL